MYRVEVDDSAVVLGQESQKGRQRRSPLRVNGGAHTCQAGDSLDVRRQPVVKPKAKYLLLT